MSVLKQFFTWWNGQTLGTRIFTARSGEKVGEDDQGNLFYRTADDSKRWVIYAGPVEASRIAPDWHGWLHRTWDEPPSEKPLARQPWEQEHVPNNTGTDLAYRPPGSVLTPARRPRATGDYDAWQPE